MRRMRPCRVGWVGALSLAVLAIVGCGVGSEGDPPPRNPLPSNGGSSVWTLAEIVDSPETDIAWVLQQGAGAGAGDRVVVLASKSAAGDPREVMGGAYILDSGDSFTFWIGDGGLPEYVEVDGWVYRFWDYETSDPDFVVNALVWPGTWSNESGQGSIRTLDIDNWYGPSGLTLEVEAWATCGGGQCRASDTSTLLVSNPVEVETDYTHGGTTYLMTLSLEMRSVDTIRVHETTRATTSGGSRFPNTTTSEYDLNRTSPRTFSSFGGEPTANISMIGPDGRTYNALDVPIDLSTLTSLQQLAVARSVSKTTTALQSRTTSSGDTMRTVVGVMETLTTAVSAANDIARIGRLSVPTVGAVATAVSGNRLPSWVGPAINYVSCGMGNLLGCAGLALDGIDYLLSSSTATIQDRVDASRDAGEFTLGRGPCFGQWERNSRTCEEFGTIAYPPCCEALAGEPCTPDECYDPGDWQDVRVVLPPGGPWYVGGAAFYMDDNTWGTGCPSIYCWGENQVAHVRIEIDGAIVDEGCGAAYLMTGDLYPSGTAIRLLVSGCEVHGYLTMCGAYELDCAEGNLFCEGVYDTEEQEYWPCGP